MAIALILIFIVVALVERRHNAQSSRNLREGLMVATLAIAAVLMILLVQDKIQYATVARMIRWTVGPLITARVFLFAQDHKGVR